MRTARLRVKNMGLTARKFSMRIFHIGEKGGAELVEEWESAGAVEPGQTKEMIFEWAWPSFHPGDFRYKASAGQVGLWAIESFTVGDVAALKKPGLLA